MLQNRMLLRQSRALLRHCCENGNIVAATGNKVACCCDNVALTLLRVWTGLKATLAHELEVGLQCPSVDVHAFVNSTACCDLDL